MIKIARYFSAAVFLSLAAASMPVAALATDSDYLEDDQTAGSQGTSTEEDRSTSSSEDPAHTGAVEGAPEEAGNIGQADEWKDPEGSGLEEETSAREEDSSQPQDPPDDFSPQTSVRSHDGGIVSVQSTEVIGNGWTVGDIYNAGNFDASGSGDLFLVTGDGTLWLYPRSSPTTFQPRQRVGQGWATLPHVMAGIDFDGDGHTDVLGVHLNGALVLYPGSGSGSFKASRQVGQGWAIFDRLIAIQRGPGGNAAVLAFRDNQMSVYGTDGKGTWKAPRPGSFPNHHCAPFPASDLFDTGHSSIICLSSDGDVNMHATTDGLAYSSYASLKTSFEAPVFAQSNGYAGGGEGSIDIADARGLLYSVKVAGLSGSSDSEPSHPAPESPGPDDVWYDISLSTHEMIGVGWPQSRVYSMGDFDGNGHADFALVNSNGQLTFYPMNSSTRFGSPRVIGQGWNAVRDIYTGIDFNGDNRSDILARMPDGRLRLYPGDARGGFLAPYYVGQGWGSFAKVWLLRNGPNHHPAIYALDSDQSLMLYSTNGQGTFLPPRNLGKVDDLLSHAFSADDWNSSGRSDLISRDDNGHLYVLQQSQSGRFEPPRLIGWGWQSMSPLLVGNTSHSSKELVAVDTRGILHLYSFTYRGINRSFRSIPLPKPTYAHRVQETDQWLTHPISWQGQPDGSTCGPTSMYMVLNYLGYQQSRYATHSLSIWNLASSSYAAVGSGASGGTSWEHHRLSVGLNRWMGTQSYRQTTFPSGWDFRSKVLDSFQTGRPVLVDTIESYGGPHYNGHTGTSSHIIVAYRYHKSNATVGFVDPGGPGSAITGYSAQRYFDYFDANRFAENFLGNYGGGGHGMVY